ncbi:MAG: prepilin-type N-terminal cleavage/methylation protein [Magnetococcales bacterium]|nr:prepilin-type N-terminal cleavage/methylation protein [Magnetococcales bacterium]HIJ85105.1 hypothetical protein [Magnetococcales bacterium]
MYDLQSPTKPHLRRERSRRCNPTGFSLVEMSVVMLTLSVVIGGGISTLSGVREKQQRQKSDSSMEKIQEALLGYAIANGYFPCPDVGVNAMNGANANFDGGEDRNGTVCRNSFGVLPWRDLSLQPRDSWLNYYSYHVATGYSNSSQPLQCNAASTLKIVEGTRLFADNVPFVVVSHGKNGMGHINPTPSGPGSYVTRTAVSGDEVENADPDDPDHNKAETYFQNAGDDHVLYMSPMLLKTKLMDAGMAMTACAPSTSSTSMGLVVNGVESGHDALRAKTKTLGDSPQNFYRQ